MVLVLMGNFFLPHSNPATYRVMLNTHVSGRDRWSTGREFGSIVHEGHVTNLWSLL